MKYLFLAAVFVASIGIGIFLTMTAADEDFVLVLPKVNERVPAALNDSQKLQVLQEKILKVSHKDKVFTKTLITSLEDVATVQVPQVALQDSAGRDNLGCLLYDHITLKFTAEGQATSGQKPTLEVTAPCEFNIEQPETLEVLLVPFGLIKERQPENAAFTLPDYPGYSFKASYLTESWPMVWLLREISYEHASGKQAHLMAPAPSPASAALPTMIW